MQGVLTSLSPLAARTNTCRFFVNLLRGLPPFRRDRYCPRSVTCRGGQSLTYEAFCWLQRPVSRGEMLLHSAPLVLNAPC